jgi:hypothetical protein
VEDDMLEHPDRLKDILLRQLRGAVGTRIAGGTDPDEVTADLTERLRRLRRMRPGGAVRPATEQTATDRGAAG